MKITPFLNGIVVAPHGITDLIHAYHYNNMDNLMKIYGGSLFFMYLSDIVHSKFHNVNLLDSAFYTSSICHFKHDFPNKNVNNFHINPYIMSSLFVTSTIFMSMDIFTIYMVLIHVPRHYIKCWKFIKDYKRILAVLILLISIPGYKIIDELYNLDHRIIEIVEAIIIGHIIYNEKYIDNK